MEFTSSIVVQDPADPHEVFQAAMRVAGIPGGAYQLHDDEEFPWLQAETGQGAVALVSVHFRFDGSMFLEEELPGGYVQIGFGIHGDDETLVRTKHSQLIKEMGAWLIGQGLHWCWSYGDDRWLIGQIDSSS